MKKKQLCLWATPQEAELFERIKQKLNRTSDSDTIRAMMIHMESFLRKKSRYIDINN